MRRKRFDERLLELKYESGLCQEIDCTEEENKMFSELLKNKESLPVDIAQYTEGDGAKRDKFYRVVPLEITSEKIQEYCALRNAKNIKTIKNCVAFFTVITIISLIATVFLLLTQL